jgi:hypothetical protein
LNWRFDGLIPAGGFAPRRYFPLHPVSSKSSALYLLFEGKDGAETAEFFFENY